MDLEVKEEYSVLGRRRFVIRIKGTSITFNVEAKNAKEAIERIKSLLKEGDNA